MRKNSADRTATLAPLWAAAMHDLSQPVQALALHSRLASGAREVEHRRESLCYIESAVHGLQAMIATLRDLALIEAGLERLDTRRCDLAGVLERVETEFAGLMPLPDARPRTPPVPVHVTAHEPLIEAMLRGLVAQAIKYATGAAIEIDCRLDVRDTGEACAVVECRFEGPPLGPARRREVFLDMSAPQVADRTAVAVLPGYALLDHWCGLLKADLSVRSCAGSLQILTVTLAEPIA